MRNIFVVLAFTIIPPIIIAALVYSAFHSNNKVNPSKPKEETETIFTDLTVGDFLYLSDDGGASLIEVATDGSFKGEYKKSDMESTGVDYDGTVTSCTYTGMLNNVEQNSDGTYTATISNLKTSEVPGSESINNYIKYINSSPVGIWEGANVTIYPKGADVSTAPGDFVSTAKREFYFEGFILPSTGIMISDDNTAFAWMQHSE